GRTVKFYRLSLHDALPISEVRQANPRDRVGGLLVRHDPRRRHRRVEPGREAEHRAGRRGGSTEVHRRCRGAGRRTRPGRPDGGGTTFRGWNGTAERRHKDNRRRRDGCELTADTTTQHAATTTWAADTATQPADTVRLHSVWGVSVVA